MNAFPEFELTMEELWTHQTWMAGDSEFRKEHLEKLKAIDKSKRESLSPERSLEFKKFMG
jgi:hypothetical protein